MLDDSNFASQISFLSTKTLSQLVQMEIERLILSGELRGGERLNELAIAGRLKVSRGPVREALRTLEEAGLVCFEKNRGATVRIVTPEEALEIYEIRANLEQLACQRFTAQVTSAQLERLRQLVDGMDEAVAANDAAAFSKMNTQFHDLIVKFSGSSKLFDIYKRLIGSLTLFRGHALVQDDHLAQSGHLAQSNAEHRNIVKLCATGDGAGAGRLIHEHIELSSRRIENSLRDFTSENAINIDVESA